MATACFFPKLPRDHPWFLLFTYGLLRLAAVPLAPVPFTLPLDPLPVFLAAALALSPRHHAPTLIGLTALTLAGDLLSGLTIPHLLFRGLSAALLFFLGHPPARPRAASLFFLFHLPVWTALLPEFRGDYPFPYIYAVGLLQGLVLHAWLAPFLLQPSREARGNPLRTLAPAVGAALLWGAFGPRTLWPPPILGSAGGLWTRLFLLPLLSLPFLHLLRRGTPGKSAPRKKRKPASRNAKVSWRDLAD